MRDNQDSLWVISVLTALIIATVALLVIIESFFVMVLWNWVIVALFAVPKLSLIMSWGLLALINLLSGNFRFEIRNRK